MGGSLGLLSVGDLGGAIICGLGDEACQATALACLDGETLPPFSTGLVARLEDGVCGLSTIGAVLGASGVVCSELCRLC